VIGICFLWRHIGHLQIQSYREMTDFIVYNTSTEDSRCTKYYQYCVKMCVYWLKTVEIEKAKLQAIAELNDTMIRNTTFTLSSL
jgi:hypothetical protein